MAASLFSAPLHGQEGDLLQIRLTFDPRLLEATLEALAEAPFPINPEIFHGRPTVVEFPAYEPQVPEIRRRLTWAGLDRVRVHTSPMLDAILS